MSFSAEEQVSHLQKLLADEVEPRQPTEDLKDILRYLRELEEYNRKLHSLFTPEILVNSLAEYSIEE